MERSLGNQEVVEAAGYVRGSLTLPIGAQHDVLLLPITVFWRTPGDSGIVDRSEIGTKMPLPSDSATMETLARRERLGDYY